MNLRKKAALALAIVALAAVSFTAISCKEPAETISVSERMDLFKADVDAGDLAGLKEHTHPDAAMYEQANATFWDTYFGDILFNFDVSGDTARVTCSGEIYTFYLKEDDADVYKVYKIVRDWDKTTIFQ